MRSIRLLAAMLCLLWMGTYAGIITFLERQDLVQIHDPAVIERLMRDVFSPVDFAAVQWLSEGDGAFLPGDDFACAVRLVRNPDQPGQEEITIAVGESALSINGEIIDTDPIMLYLLDGLFHGLFATTLPGAKPLG